MLQGGRIDCVLDSIAPKLVLKVGLQKKESHVSCQLSHSRLGDSVLELLVGVGELVLDVFVREELLDLSTNELATAVSAKHLWLKSCQEGLTC